MLTKKSKIVGSVVCFAMAILILFIGNFVPVFINFADEENTTEFHATVDNVELKNDSYCISVEEYNCRLMADSKAVIEKNLIEELNRGTTIYFRIFSVQKNPMVDQYVEQIIIVSLRTEGTTIVSLESYKKTIANQILTIRITAVCFAVLFIVSGFLVVIKRKAEKRNEKKEFDIV